MQCEWVEQVGCSHTTVTIYSMLGMLRNMLDYPNTWPRVDAMREFTSVPYERLQPSLMPHDDTPMSPSVAHMCADESTSLPPPHLTFLLYTSAPADATHRLILSTLTIHHSHKPPQ